MELLGLSDLFLLTFEIAVEGLSQEYGIDPLLEKMHFKVQISGSYLISYSL